MEQLIECHKVEQYLKIMKCQRKFSILVKIIRKHDQKNSPEAVVSGNERLIKRNIVASTDINASEWSFVSETIVPKIIPL